MRLLSYKLLCKFLWLSLRNDTECAESYFTCRRRLKRHQEAISEAGLSSLLNSLSALYAPQPPPHRSLFSNNAAAVAKTQFVWETREKQKMQGNYRVFHLIVYLGWVDLDSGVLPSYPAAQPLQPNSHLAWQIWAMLNTQNPNQFNPVHEQWGHPVEESWRNARDMQWHNVWFVLTSRDGKKRRD